MKTISKLFALAVLASPLLGCQGSDDTKVMMDDKGKSQQTGVPPSTVAKSSEDFANQQKANDPLKNNSAYKSSGK